MPHLRHCAVAQQHFHDVEAEFYLWIFQEPQIVERGGGEEFFLARIYGVGGARPVFGGTCFHLNETEAVAIPKNQINLAAFGAEVGGEKFQASGLQEFFRREFAEFAAPQMLRLGLAGEAGFELGEKFPAGGSTLWAEFLQADILPPKKTTQPRAGLGLFFRRQDFRL